MVGLQLICTCTRNIGGCDDRFDNKVYQLSNVRRIRRISKPGTSTSEPLFEHQEIKGIIYDFPLPEIIKTVRVLSPAEIKNKCDTIIRRITVGKNSISYYDETHRQLNAAFPKHTDRPKVYNERFSVIDLTEDDTPEMIEVENNISTMSISSGSTEQFPNSNNTIHSFNAFNFSMPNCTSTPAIHEMENPEELDASNATFDIVEGANDDLPVVVQPIEAIAENATPLNNINNPGLEELLNNIDFDAIATELGFFNTTEAIDYYIDNFE